jgi:hypothetical protein
MLSLLQTGLLQDAVQGTWGQVVAGLTGKGYSPRFGRMLELAMAAPCGDQGPTVLLQHSKYLANFHRHDDSTWDPFIGLDGRARALKEWEGRRAISSKLMAHGQHDGGVTLRVAAVGARGRR